jgi:osmoprotectant transport system permease protein
VGGHALDAGAGGMTTTLAILGQFGDAISYIFQGETTREGADVGGSQFLELTWEHLKLSFAAMGIACALSVPLGLWLGHIRRGSFLAISASNVGRAVPSLALIAFFVAYLGTGFVNVTLALVLLAIPPILTNTYVAVTQVDRDTVDAARGMGMTGAEIVRKVELPLALPLIFGGVRTSTVNVIATATIAPLAGINTLGDPIINVSGYGDTGRLAAAMVVAALAVFSELALGAVQRAVTPAGLKLEPDSASRRLRQRFGREATTWGEART